GVIQERSVVLFLLNRIPDDDLYIARPPKDPANLLDHRAQQMTLDPVFGISIRDGDYESPIVIAQQFGMTQPRVIRGAVQFNLKLSKRCTPGVLRVHAENPPR